MSTAILLALVLGYAWTETAFGALPSLDAARPLVRFSPTRGTTNPLYADDGFGYSAAIHHTTEDLSGMTLEQVLEQVRIIAGSPRGRFPGGFDSMFPDELADQLVCNTSEPEYVGLTPDEERRCFGVSGLVYLCRAHTNSCEPFLGNGDKDSNDGFLYKRDPNTILTFAFTEYSNQALIGATMFSTGDYFVACGPRFSYMREIFDDPNFIPVFEPRGRCVFSGRDLQDFKILDPCDAFVVPNGSPSNQADGGFCQAGSSIYMSKSNTVLLGAPGYQLSEGNFGLYNDLTAEGVNRSRILDTTGEFLLFPLAGIPPATSPTDRYSDVRYSYFGTAVVAGTFNGSESYIVSSLRYEPTENSPGAINLINDIGNSSVPEENLVGNVTTLLGNQLGESYGKVLVAADLNGDGFDELIVTAPTYSGANQTRSPELGRVYVLSNVNQSPVTTFETVAVLTGTARLGRFGNAATNLGDLNNDGLEDIAISAPYEGSGVVYIYHGNATSYIEPTPSQIITAEDMISRVSELNSLSSFGAFLQGNADIDNNQYRDLLIGAEESQALFVLRARPVATITLTVTSNESAIVPSAADCILQLDGNAYPCFEVTVCGVYTGRGLTTFEANYTITEIRQPSAERRLRFDDPLPLSFTGPGDTVCNTLTAYVDLEVSGELDDLRATVEMQQFALPTAAVDATLQLTDLSTEPVIVSEPTPLSVGIAIDCDNNMCISDLGLSLNSLLYLNGSSHPSEDNRLVVGAITSMRMDLTYFNLGDQALNFEMRISLPEGFVLFSPETESGVVTCLVDDNVTDDAITMYTCTDFRVPLMQNESRAIRFSWGDFSSTLRGDEGILSVSAEIYVVNRTENFEQPEDLGNNIIQQNISVVAESTYAVQVTYSPTTPTYMVSELEPIVESTSQLGSPFSITVMFTNSGPSTLPTVSLVIYLPLRNATETGDYYYLYALSVSEDEASCAISDVREITNPSGLVVDEQRRRKRRSLRENAPGIVNRVYRTIRQTPPERSLNCATNQQLCARLECNLTDIGALQTGLVVIRARIDNRFFYDKSADYVLGTYVRVVEDSFVDTGNSPTEYSSSVTLSMQAMISDSSGIPDWVIAICVVAGFVFIIIVALILGLLIFLHLRRRKRRGEHEIKEDEVETYNEKAFDQDASNL